MPFEMSHTTERGLSIQDDNRKKRLKSQLCVQGPPVSAVINSPLKPLTIGPWGQICRAQWDGRVEVEI